jgi:5'-methylthioadenosine phosphorylase
MSRGVPAVILGSAFEQPVLGGVTLQAVPVDTPWGWVILHRCGPGLVLLRHGEGRRYLAHQIPYRAHASALARMGCDRLLVTSSAGLLDPGLPLDRPLLVDDLYMPDNRLPDGSACTMFPSADPQQAHLVLEQGLFSPGLSRRVEQLLDGLGFSPGPRVSFGYVPGPRTKTALENRALRQLGVQANSMTLGPEVVLANELGISTAGLVIGHKHSGAAASQAGLGDSFQGARECLERLVPSFLGDSAPAPPFGNRLFRFS